MHLGGGPDDPRASNVGRCFEQRKRGLPRVDCRPLDPLDPSALDRESVSTSEHLFHGQGVSAGGHLKGVPHNIESVDPALLQLVHWHQQTRSRAD
jgi:hypothetical protein